MIFNKCTEETETKPEVLQYLLHRYQYTPSSTSELKSIDNIKDNIGDANNFNGNASNNNEEEKPKVYHGSDHNPELDRGVAIAFGTIGGMICVLLFAIFAFYLHGKCC